MRDRTWIACANTKFCNMYILWQLLWHFFEILCWFTTCERRLGYWNILTGTPNSLLLSRPTLAASQFLVSLVYLLGFCMHSPDFSFSWTISKVQYEIWFIISNLDCLFTKFLLKLEQNGIWKQQASCITSLCSFIQREPLCFQIWLNLPSFFFFLSVGRGHACLQCCSSATVI